MSPKTVTFQSEVNNALLLTETANNERDAHMSGAITRNYTKGGFPEMQ